MNKITAAMHRILLPPFTLQPALARRFPHPNELNFPFAIPTFASYVIDVVLFGTEVALTVELPTRETHIKIGTL
jgi:hypothetical protein